MHMDVLVVSIVAGLFTAAWGAYKDAPYERFSRASFWRSTWFCLVIAGVLLEASAFRERSTHLYLVQVFFLVMGVERIAIEIYKPCFRREDQGKYLIPQDCSFFGLHVENSAALVVFGVASIFGVLGLLSIGTTIHSYPQHLAVSVGTGLFICCGGAAKDAPFEGFQPRKFLRSALVLAAVSPLLYLLGRAPLGMLIFINGGFERLIVESYKTYFTPHRPGKFRRDLPVIDHGILVWRPVFRAVAIGTAILLVTLYAHALMARP